MVARLHCPRLTSLRLSVSTYSPIRSRSPALAKHLLAWRTEEGPWLLAAIVLAVGFGAALAATPLAGLIVVAAVVVGVAYRRPYLGTAGAAIACAVYLGVYLRYRTVVGSLPISALDVLPVLLLASALGTRARAPVAEIPPLSRQGLLAVCLMGLGLLFGIVVGVLDGAEGYQLVRVVRTEIELLATAVAGLLGGWSQEWRRGLVVGLYAAGVIAALQQLASFASIAFSGRSLWGSLATGSPAGDLFPTLSPGHSGDLRDNYLATFIMLPALGAALYRLRTYDWVVALLILAAAAVSLSRAVWITTMVLLVAVIAARAARKQLNVRAAGALGVLLCTAALTVGQLGGPFLAGRLKDTVSSQSDPSAVFRKEESRLAVRKLTDSPVSFVLGTGAGVLVDPSLPAQSAIASHMAVLNPTNTILEDEVLARWTNLTALSVVGCILLLLGGGMIAFRQLRRTVEVPVIYAMAASLPIILVAGFFAGTLLQLQVSLPFWLLAGTVLAGSYEARGREPDRKA
jgi:hypothetical protein